MVKMFVGIPMLGKPSLVGEGGPLTVSLKVSSINPARIVGLSRGNPQCHCDTPYGLL